MTQTLFIDFETYMCSKDAYSLKSMSMTEYIRDDRFSVHGFAYQWGTEGAAAHWVSGAHTIWAWIQAQDWADTVVVSQNCKFDGGILAWRFGVKPLRWVDTVGIAKATLGNTVPGFSLKVLAECLKLTQKGELKIDGKKELSDEEEKELSAYCKNDVEICRGIYVRLLCQFPASQFESLDWTIRCFVEPKLVLDEKTLEEGVKNEKARREKLIAKSGIDRKILSSNKQFAEYLRGRGYLVPTKLSKTTGKPIPALGKSDEGLEILADSVPEIAAARIAAKANLLETRGQALLNVARTGPFPFDVGFSGAVQTHRYSGGGGAGGNPQNFTRGSFLRTAVTAPSGMALVVGDFAAIELRILAFLSRDPKLVDAITHGRDIYCEFASLIYGRTITKADKAERQFGKAAILGLGYGMGATKFQTVVQQLKDENGKKLFPDITRDYAYNTVQLYRSTYGAVPRLWRFADDLLPLLSRGGIACLHFAPFIKVRRNALVLPSGLLVQYPNLRRNADGDYEYDAYEKLSEPTPRKLYGAKLIENICQALAGEICKEAIARIPSAVGAVHDEIIAVTHDYDPSAVSGMQRLMEIPPTWWPMLRLKAEVKSGPNWSACK